MGPRRRRRRYHRLARHISKQLNLSLLPPARTNTNFSPQYARARERSAKPAEGRAAQPDLQLKAAGT